MKSSTLYFYFASGLTALSLIGCGPQNIGEDKKKQENNSLSTTTTTLITNDGKNVSACSRDGVLGNDIEYRMTPYREASGQINGNYIRVQITNLPARYVSETLDLRFYKWRADSNGATSISPTPIEYRFEKRNSTGGWEVIPSKDPYTRFNYKEAEAMGEYLGISHSTPLEVYTKVSIILSIYDPNFEYQALRLSLQGADSSGLDQEVAHEDGLLPPFWADPFHYRLVKPTVLSNLHPLNNLTAPLTQLQYEDKTRDFCF